MGRSTARGKNARAVFDVLWTIPGIPPHLQLTIVVECLDFPSQPDRSLLRTNAVLQALAEGFQVALVTSE